MERLTTVNCVDWETFVVAAFQLFFCLFVETLFRANGFHLDFDFYSKQTNFQGFCKRPLLNNWQSLTRK